MVNGRKRNIPTINAELGRIWNGFLERGKTAQTSIRGHLAWLLFKAPQQKVALNEFFEKFELIEIQNNKMYKEKLGFKKKDLFKILLERIQYIIENIPSE